MLNPIPLNAGADLYEELKQYAGDFKKDDTVDVYPDDTLEVTLSPGNYTLSNRLEFRCNVIIRGDGAKISGTNFGAMGSLSACNNIWEKSDSYSGYAKYID